MRYDPKVVDHYENPRNVGTLDVQDSNVGTGIVGSAACGDMIQLQIRVSPKGRIEEARFKAFGCGSAIAVSSLATERIEGTTLEEALRIRNAEISEHLDLPEIKRHCSVLVEEAIAAAVADYRSKQAGEDTAAQILTMTPRAVAQAQAFIAKRIPAPLGLRVGVVQQGCAGSSYVLEYVDEKKPDDIVLKIHELSIYVDSCVVPLLRGTQVDYIEENLQARFVFNNPNEIERCGCGNSFRAACCPAAPCGPTPRCFGKR